MAQAAVEETRGPTDMVAHALVPRREQVDLAKERDGLGEVRVGRRGDAEQKARAVLRVVYLERAAVGVDRQRPRLRRLRPFPTWQPAREESGDLDELFARCLRQVGDNRRSARRPSNVRGRRSRWPRRRSHA